MSTLDTIGVVDSAALTPSSLPATGNAPGHKVIKYPYIDALRGYAVLIVILSHTGGMFPELPYPIKKLTNMGWTGVQLFFLVSCVTLMMSWRSDEKKGIASPLRFWIRRYFRIAPMYYLAALFYLLVEPPIGGFDLRQFLATITFINAWHPVLLSTLDDGWRVVPGGWSISVEFSFYLLFPLIVTLVRTPRAGIIFSIISMAIGVAANDLTQGYFLRHYGEPATSTFLYFWLPNQLFVFALGTLLFFTIDALRSTGAPAWVRWHPSLQICACVAVIVVLGEHPTMLPSYFSTEEPPLIFYVSIILMFFSILLAANPHSVWVNKPIRALGTVSFSAYIFHFFVVHQLAALPIFDARHQVGVTAIVVCILLFVVTVPITFGISWITYKFIEEPMIELGSRLASSLASRRHR